MIQACLDRLIEDQVRSRLTSVSKLFVVDQIPYPNLSQPSGELLAMCTIV